MNLSFKSNAKRQYKLKEGVDWWYGDTKPKHNQIHYDTKEYWNANKNKWCKNKSKILYKDSVTGNDIIYNEFKKFPLTVINNLFKPELRERVAMFLHLVDMKCINTSRDYITNVYWSDVEFRAVLGNNHKSIVRTLHDKRMVTIEYKKCPWDANLTMVYLRLWGKVNSSKENIAGTHHVKNPVYEKRLIKYFESSGKDADGNIDKDARIDYIQNVLNSSSIFILFIEDVIYSVECRKLKELIANEQNPFISKSEKNKGLKRTLHRHKYPDEYPKYLTLLYEQLVKINDIVNEHQKKHFCVLGAQSFGNRISHIFSNVPKEIRKHIKIQGEETCELDITSSQPVFLYIALKEIFPSGNIPLLAEIPIPQSYINLIEKIYTSETKDIYACLSKTVKDIFGVDIERMYMKTFFFKLVFGNPKYPMGEYSREELTEKLIGKDFYKFLVSLSKKRLGFKEIDCNYKNLSLVLQQTEALFMNRIFDLLMNEKIPFIPVYDCVIIKKKDARKVIALIDDYKIKHPWAKFVNFKMDK